MSNNYPNIDPN